MGRGEAVTQRTLDPPFGGSNPPAPTRKILWKAMDISEAELIRWIRSLASPFQKKVLVGIGDDAAVIKGREGYSYLFTTDTLVENVHFRWEFVHPYQVGWKALAVNASDIAAMGGYPVFALVTFGIPTSFLSSRVKEVYKGLVDLSTRLNLEISGGDIVRSRIFFISISVVGEVEAGRAVLRSGAKPGDSVYLTGDIGRAATGFLSLKEGKKLHLPSATDSLRRRWLMPFPRIKEAREIAMGGVATAMIDLSDGLSSDLYHILEESGVGAEIWEKNLPIASETEKVCHELNRSPLEVALHGGEDYELLFTAPATTNVEKIVSFQVTRIGKILEGSGLFLLNKKGERKKLKSGGWDHFLSTAS